MKNFFKSAWIFLSVILSLSYLLSSFTSYIPPASFSFVTFFALAFPWLLLCQFAVCVISFFVQKRLAVFMLLCLPLGYKNALNTFALHGGEWQFAKQDSSLRIMTWNVENFVDLSAQADPKAEIRIEMLKVIQQYNPDILCLQEFKNVENGWRRISVRHELDSLGYKYQHCSNDFFVQNGERIVSGGAAIYSKLPLMDIGKTQIRTDIKESLIYADVMYDNKPLRIYTAHLASFELYPVTYNEYTPDDENIYKVTYQRKGTIEQKLRATEVLHQQQVSKIRSLMNKDTLPKIYCGDMNTIPASYNYRMLRGDMQDAFIKGSGIGTTFYKLAPTLRIDICFVDNRMQVLQSSVIERKLSDHYPVITDVSWKK